MPLFLTTGKVRTVLQEKGAESCVADFGQGCGKPLLNIIFSEQEDIKTRLSAIHALFMVEEKSPGKMPIFDKAGGPFATLYNLLPEELKKSFTEHAFQEGTGRRTAFYFINLTRQKHVIYDYICASKDRRLDELVAEFLQDANRDTDSRIECAAILIKKHDSQAAPAILATLHATSLHLNEYFVDRLVDMLDRLGISGLEAEDILIEKFNEIRIGDEVSSVRMAVGGLIHKDWKLDPNGRIITILTRIGGKKTLTAMFRKMAAGNTGSGMVLPSVNTETDKAIIERTAMDGMLVMLRLMEGAQKIEKRLKESGELKSLREIEGYDEFMRKHGYNSPPFEKAD